MHSLFCAWQDFFGKGGDGNGKLGKLKRRGTGVDSYYALLDRELKRVKASWSVGDVARQK